MGAEIAELPQQHTDAVAAPVEPLPWNRLMLPAIGSGLLLYLSHFPVAWGVLGWVALVPLLFLVRAPAGRWSIFLASWYAGWLFYVLAIGWMQVAHFTMAIAWLLLSFYCSLYVPVAVGLTRYFDRRTSLPLVLIVPAVWTVLDWVRAHFLTGFAWYFLGHTQHDFLPVIQIADLAGAYGVTFLVAAVNAWLFELLWSRPGVRRWFHASEPVRCRLAWQGGALLLLLAGVLGYGFWRLGQDEFTAGPRVALVQTNLDQRIRNDGTSLTGPTMIRHTLDLNLWAAGQHADLIVWPETSWPENWIEVSADLPPAGVPSTWRDDDQYTRKLARFLASHARTALLVGLNSHYLEADGQGRRYNSAVLLRPDGAVAGHYHKVHRVPFGEYVPLRDWLPWLSFLSPYDFDYSVTPGTSFTRFSAGDHRFGVIICYEDSDPTLARQYVADDPVDFLVNISNDGWFDGTSEHDEHLAICRFRAVECRRAVLRSVNMGLSAVIDGNGRVLEPGLYRLDDDEVRQGAGPLPVSRWHEFKQSAGVLIAAVPLDHRSSLYARWGDWLPIGCGLLLAGAWLTTRRRPAAGKPGC